MLREQQLPSPTLRVASPIAPLMAVPSAASRPSAAPQSAEADGAVESVVLEALLRGELAGGLLLDAIADQTATVLEQVSDGAGGLTPAEVQGVAARVATGLAVALLQSDLAERIAARLAAQAPFAEGWRSCPE